MGVFGSRWATRSGGTAQPPVAFSPGEREIARTAGCITKNGVPWVGGDLVLTDLRLILSPVNTLELVRLTTLGLRIVRIPQAGTVITVIGWAQRLMKPSFADADGITAVSVGRPGPRPFKPPTFVVHRERRAPIEFGVLASRGALNISPKNVAARDEFVRSIEVTLL